MAPFVHIGLAIAFFVAWFVSLSPIGALLSSVVGETYAGISAIVLFNLLFCVHGLLLFTVFDRWYERRIGMAGGGMDSGMAAGIFVFLPVSHICASRT